MSSGSGEVDLCAALQRSLDTFRAERAERGLIAEADLARVSGCEWCDGPEDLCPVHEWCPDCRGQVRIDEVSDEQVGFEERARGVVVYRLACGHEVVQ